MLSSIFNSSINEAVNSTSYGRICAPADNLEYSNLWGKREDPHRPKGHLPPRGEVGG
jgi:hypothetical protein